MNKLLLRFAFIIAMTSILFTSCKKDSFEPDQDTDYNTTSIKASIPRIVENNDGGINVFVNVTNQDGEAIAGLNEDNFKFELISSGGQVVPLQSTGSSQLPSLILTALTMDYSGSMYQDTVSIPGMESAIGTFINMKNTLDQVEIIKFSDTIQVTVPITDNQSLLIAGLNDTTFVGQGATKLYGALEQGITDVIALANTNPTYLPSVVGFTDGKNNLPPLNADTLILNAITQQIPIYTIGYGVNPDTAQLTTIAGQTGAQFFWSPGVNDIQTVYQHINGQLANTTIIPLPGPQTKGQVTIRCTATYESAAGTLTAKAEKEFYY